MKAIRFAWVVSMVATAGSLYFSEIAGFIPCSLCWWQRIFMYPLTILLGVAVFKNEKTIIPYVMGLPIIGLCISVFHYLKQKVDAFSEILPCSVGVPCTGDYINWFGFVTIPFLAGTASLLILTAFIYELRKNKNKPE